MPAAAMNEPPRPEALDKRLLRRILPLVILASAFALVAVQLSRAMRHDVRLELGIPAELCQTLERTEVFLLRPDGELASMTQLRYDAANPPACPLSTEVRLTAGTYQVEVRLHQAGLGAADIRRTIEVTGDATIRLNLGKDNDQ